MGKEPPEPRAPAAAVSLLPVVMIAAGITPLMVVV